MITMAKKKASDPLIGGTRLSNWRDRLADEHAGNRVDAVAALEQMGASARRAMPLLIEALKDTDARVRALAATAIWRIGHNAAEDAVGAMPALIEALKDPSNEVRRMAAVALSALGPAAEPAIPALLELLESDDSAVRLSAAQALGAVGSAAAVAVPALGRLLLHTEMADATASWIADALGKIGAAAVNALIEALLKGAPNVRPFAAFALGEIGLPARAAVPALVAALKDKGRALLCFAAGSLGHIGAAPEYSIPALLELFNAEDEEVRRAAVSSIGQFGSSAMVAVPELVKMLSEKSWFRLFATEALGKIGPKASSALPALDLLLRQSTSARERKFREAVEYAIHLIEATPLSVALQEELAPGPPDGAIDFGRTKKAVARMLAEGLSDFAKEHPEVEIGCVALFGHGFGRSATLCIGMPAECGRDFQGGVYDFRYREYAQEDFSWWPDLYEVGSEFRIKMPDGKMVRGNFDKGGNRAIDKPLFELLKQVMREASPFEGLRRSKSFLVGVEMADSDLMEFWVPKE